MFRAVVNEPGDAGLDLFATCLNNQLPVYVSPCPDPQALALDALSLDCNTLPLAYAFPPMPILPKVLQKIRDSTVTVILIAPAWPTQSWFPDLLNLLIRRPVEIPVLEDLLTQQVGRQVWTHRNPAMYNYHAWMLSGIPSLKRGFSEAAAQRIAIPQRGSTRTVYDGKWAEFCRWCSGQKKDPIRATVPVVADFLIHLFDRTPPLAVSTIRGYRSAIASTIPDGFRITESKEISNLFRSLGVDRPVTRTFYPKWSLKIVLNYLLKELFEHISKCSLENLTIKTVFLVTLASGRRRSEIHALSVDPECFRFSSNLSQVSLLTEPGFLSKTQKTSKMQAKIVIQSLATHVGHDLSDYELCLVHALKAYKDKTKSEAIRKNRKRLFIPYRDSQDDIRPYHISKWIVELVKRAHRDANEDAYQLANVTVHEVRAIATSWAAYNNAPLEEIMQAADWSGNTTFTSFYSRAMAAHAEGLYDLGPIVSAQRGVHRPQSPSGT